MIECATEYYDLVYFKEDSGCVKDKDEVHYSAEGKALKEKCERLKITMPLEYNKDE